MRTLFAENPTSGALRGRRPEPKEAGMNGIKRSTGAPPEPKGRVRYCPIRAEMLTLNPGEHLIIEKGKITIESLRPKVYQVRTALEDPTVHCYEASDGRLVVVRPRV